MRGGIVVESGARRPLAGVVVSDGLAVTRTDARGRFALPARADAEFVFVCAPASHEPLRRPWYADVRGAPTGDVELALHPRRDVRTGLRLVHVTDLHLAVGGRRIGAMLTAGLGAPAGVDVTGETDPRELHDDLTAVVQRERPDLVVVTGDIADSGAHAELEAYRAVVDSLGVPVASVPGNHDYLSCMTDDAITAFTAWWDREGRHEGVPLMTAFERRVFGGDWRRDGSGRAPWLDVLGPPYYSFDCGGCHVVVYDGEGLRRYGADYPQDEWLAADLALVAPGTPVLVCTHFPEPRDFFDARFAGVRLVGSLSGHWHSNRLWPHGDARHWTSSTLGFAGIDHSPRGYRVVEIDGGRARARWVTVAGAARDDARPTGAAALTAARVVVATERPDGTGAVMGIGTDDGEARWSHLLDSAPRGGVAASEVLTVALTQTGTLRAWDTQSGAPLWETTLGDASRRWCLAPPVLAGPTVFAGVPAGVWAFDARSGELRWERRLADGDWLATWAGPAATDEVVVLGAASGAVHLAAFDARSGEPRWRTRGRDFAGVAAPPCLVGDTCVAVHVHGWVVAHALLDGTERWRAPLDDAWPLAAPVAGDGCVHVRTTRGVSVFDLASGARRGDCRLAPSSAAARPYGREPGGRRVPLVRGAGLVWTASGPDLVAVGDDGAIRRRVTASAEIATIAAAGGAVAGVTADGRVVRPPAAPRRDPDPARA